MSLEDRVPICSTRDIGRVRLCFARVAGVRGLTAVLTALLWLSWSTPSQAQTLLFVKQFHYTVGGGVGLYMTDGGFALGEQGLSLTGIHLDPLRLGFSHSLATNIRMGMAAILGMSYLFDDGYSGTTADGRIGQSNLGFHWGAEMSGYYRFPNGLTLGLGASILMGQGKHLDTSFFRVLPAVGWEFNGPLEEWYWHLQWVAAVTLLHGLSEHNTQPESNLSWTGFQVVYGF